jgi:curved DNA-binding protein CbpA
MTTLYDTLGVRQDATEDEIKRAYRKAAMRWHPDRHVGPEDVARAAFQEIKDAYAILSDAAQRQVYDDVFAEEMRNWESRRRQDEQLRAEREAAAQAAAEAAYAEMVTLAMRFVSDGYNRDVVFGVLLGRQCDAPLANRIADSVWALHESRQSQAVNDTNAAESPVPPEHREKSPNDAPMPAQRHAGVFQTLWHNFFGISS